MEILFCMQSWNKVAFRLHSALPPDYFDNCSFLRTKVNYILVLYVFLASMVLIYIYRERSLLLFPSVAESKFWLPELLNYNSSLVVVLLKMKTGITLGYFLFLVALYHWIWVIRKSTCYLWNCFHTHPCYSVKPIFV